MDAATYGGLRAQQHSGVFEVFRRFLKRIRPRRILEIGTAEGGFTLFLRDSLDALALRETPIRTYDIGERDSYGMLRQRGIDVRIENVFHAPGQGDPVQGAVVDFIRQPGPSLVLCDGGNKVQEFNLLAPLLKVGDFIMAHDYVVTEEEFQQRYKGKIWNWCEVEERHLTEASRANNLVDFNRKAFESVVWVCKRKAQG